MRNFLYLALVLFKRDFKAKYRRTILGWFWAILPPVVTIIIFNLLRGVVDIPSEGVPYIVFSTVSVIPWSFFSRSVTQSAPGVLSNSNIMKKSAVPREVFPFVGVLNSFVDLAVSLGILIVLMLVYRLPLTIHLLWFPVLILLLAMLGLGIGMGVSSFGVYRRDLLNALPLALQLLLFAAPIGYPLSQVSEKLRPLFILNPLTGYIESFRAILVFGRAPDFELLGLSVGMSILIFAIGWLVFRQMSQYFTDVL